MLSPWVMATVYVAIVDQVQPTCSAPWLGHKLPWCYVPSFAETVDATRLPFHQLQLEAVMNSVGEGRGLAMDMLLNEYDVRDLNIQIKHSKLNRKDELAGWIDVLISLNTETSEYVATAMIKSSCPVYSGLSDFTARVGGIADWMIAFHRYAVRNLQAIGDRQTTRPSLSQRLLSTLSPWSAFQSSYKTEKDLGGIFAKGIPEMAGLLPRLIDQASDLCQLLRSISVALDTIRGLALDQLEHTPEISVLAALWEKLARPDDYAVLKSYRALLNDITVHCEQASELMRDTLHALNKMRSDMNQLRNVRSSPVLLWRDVPLEMAIDMMSQAM
jgi:hypothetical protein